MRGSRVIHSPGMARKGHGDVSALRALTTNLLLSPAPSFAHIFMVMQLIVNKHHMPNLVISCHSGLMYIHIHQNVAGLCFMQVENKDI